MSWRKSFNRARRSEAQFRSYATERQGEVNRTSGWIRENNVVRFKVGPNPFDKDILEEYFDDYLGNYRSGLDRMIFTYCKFHGQNANSSEFPIRDTREKLEKRVRGWQGWDAVHKQKIFEFIELHSPFTDSSQYGSLVSLSKLRNTSEHREEIVPIPDVKVDKDVRIYSQNGSVNFTLHSPINQDPHRAWNVNDYDAEARFGEFYGVGYEANSPVRYKGVVRVRFEAVDPTDNTFAPVDVLKFMTTTTAAISKIEEDFMNEFDYLF